MIFMDDNKPLAVFNTKAGMGIKEKLVLLLLLLFFLLLLLEVVDPL